MDKQKPLEKDPSGETSVETPPTIPNKSNRGNGGFFWAFFLIALGIIFLLNNLEILPWNIWGSIWRLWPVFLIIGGIQIIFGKSRLLSFFISFLCFFLIMFGLVLGFTDLIKPSAGSFLAQVKEKFTSILLTGGNELSDNLVITDNEFKGITKRELKIELDSSTFTINSSDTNNYLELVSKYYENIGAPEVTKKVENDILKISFETESKSWDIFNPALNRRYDFTLGQKELDTKLDLKLVSGKSETRLKGMNISEIKAQQVSGSGVIDITQPINNANKISLDMTSGSMVLNLPNYSNLEINYEIVTGSLKIGDETLKGDGQYLVETSVFPEPTIYDIQLDIKIVSGSMEINPDN